ncbi:dynein intermediate chain 3, ciliary-like [Stegodyphus dumicola]|uniref:dynein intermediate chain 3, ciliary-like n=1 Tax=Stegodyphus dumicola TaxID=202533 RepID=UPI0015AC6835|nr:dynein intermediate chain 3, ciliary-like [Stegodyphus dumicola]
MDINFIYTMKRKDFGKPCIFTDVGPNVIIDIDPDPGLRKEFQRLRSMNREIDNSAKMAAHEVNTLSYPTESRGICHTEGGWPASVDTTDEESMTRFRKKADKDKSYVNTVKTLADFVESYIMENNSVDIYEEYFEGERIKKGKEAPFKTLNIFRDISTKRRSVMNISWSADQSKFAAAYAFVGMDDYPVDVVTDSYVWDIENYLTPYCILKADVTLNCIEYSPYDSNIVLGGYSNGQIALWDLRTGGYPQQLSAVHVSHTQKVSGLKFLRTWNSMDFFTASTDGKVMSWSTKNLSFPTSELVLDPSESEITNLDAKYTVSCVEYDPTLRDKFMLGTEQGAVLSFNRKGNSKADCLIAKYDTSSGPLLSLERNAFFPQMFASCDAWNVNVWTESATDIPILSLNSEDGYFTDLSWSPARASLLYLSKTNGKLEIWDIPGKHSQPISNLQLEKEPLFCVCTDEQGHRLICGSVSGYIHLLQVPEYFKTISNIEMNLVEAAVKAGGENTQGKSRHARLHEMEEDKPSDLGFEYWWDPPEKAEDLYEEYKNFF